MHACNTLGSALGSAEWTTTAAGTSVEPSEESQTVVSWDHMTCWCRLEAWCHMFVNQLSIFSPSPIRLTNVSNAEEVEERSPSSWLVSTPKRGGTAGPTTGPLLSQGWLSSARFFWRVNMSTLLPSRSTQIYWDPLLHYPIGSMVEKLRFYMISWFLLFRLSTNRLRNCLPVHQRLQDEQWLLNKSHQYSRWLVVSSCLPKVPGMFPDGDQFTYLLRLVESSWNNAKQYTYVGFWTSPWQRSSSARWEDHIKKRAREVGWVVVGRVEGTERKDGRKCVWYS